MNGMSGKDILVQSLKCKVVEINNLEKYLNEKIGTLCGICLHHSEITAPDHIRNTLKHLEEARFSLKETINLLS